MRLLNGAASLQLFSPDWQSKAVSLLPQNRDATPTFHHGASLRHFIFHQQCNTMGKYHPGSWCGNHQILFCLCHTFQGLQCPIQVKPTLPSTSSLLCHPLFPPPPTFHQWMWIVPQTLYATLQGQHWRLLFSIRYHLSFDRTTGWTTANQDSLGWDCFVISQRCPADCESWFQMVSSHSGRSIYGFWHHYPSDPSYHWALQQLQLPCLFSPAHRFYITACLAPPTDSTSLPV